MTELDLIIDLHCGTERQGPGSVEDTRRALSLTGGLTKKEGLEIADLGCGNGGQTLTLANHLNGHITAVDLFPAFLEELTGRSETAGFNETITPLEASIDALPFEQESLDLIWSESSIYNIGFENGIKNWGQFLKPGGYLCVSEITWLTEKRPAEIENFWNAAYPEIGTASEKMKVIEESGFTPRGYFTLPPESWIDTYYKPLESKFDSFLGKHANSELAMRIVKEHEDEIALYMQNQAYYSYGFYIAEKTI